MPISVLRFRPGLLIPPSAYLDTNLLLFARDQLSPKYRSASTCLAELIRGGAELYVSQLVFDEMWWQLFRASFRLAWNRELTGNDYKRDTSIWRDNWTRIRQISSGRGFAPWHLRPLSIS